MNTQTTTPTGPRSSYQRLKLGQTTAARVRGGSPAASEGTTPTLRVVADGHRPRQELTGSQQPVHTEAATLRLDAQCRGSARRLLQALGWGTDTPLAPYLDHRRGLIWLQSQDARGSHDTDGSDCACDRCQRATAQPPALPHEPRAADAGPSITAKGELNLNRGLLAAIGAKPGDTVVAFVREDLAAIAITSAAGLLDRLLTDDVEADAPTEADNVTPLLREDLG